VVGALHRSGHATARDERHRGDAAPGGSVRRRPATEHAVTARTPGQSEPQPPEPRRSTSGWRRGLASLPCMVLAARAGDPQVRARVFDETDNCPSHDLVSHVSNLSHVPLGGGRRPLVGNGTRPTRDSVVWPPREIRHDRSLVRSRQPTRLGLGYGRAVTRAPNRPRRIDDAAETLSSGSPRGGHRSGPRASPERINRTSRYRASTSGAVCRAACPTSSPASFEPRSSSTYMTRRRPGQRQRVPAGCVQSTS
jgi:hypothetical protein